MKIAYPVTDYIPASILTTRGDIVVRGATVPQRQGAGSNNSVLQGKGAGAIPYFDWIDGPLDLYLKGLGNNLPYAFSTLALRDTGIFIGSTMRNSAGNQVIAGIGFESSVVIFLAADTVHGNNNWCIGFDDGTNRHCITGYFNGINHGVHSNFPLYIARDVGNALEGRTTVIGADGFTITWTLVGVCSANFIYLCLP